MAKKYIFNFNEGCIADFMLLGEKGANLAQIHQLGLPIPFGFTISTDGCKQFLKNNEISNDMFEQIMKGLKAIEKETEKVYGDSEAPLLLSIRTGSTQKCAGLAKTIINVGINDEIASKMSKANKNLNFAWECYSRFIKDYAVMVKKLDNQIFKDIEYELRATNKGYPEPEILQKLISNYKKIYKKLTKESFPQDVMEQLVNCLKACLSSWQSNRAKDFRRSNNISDDLGCAVSVQAMAFGNKDMASGVGVAHTRNHINGDKNIAGELLRNAQEKSSLNSTFTYTLDELKEVNPAIHAELSKAARIIEEYYQDVKAIEFCIESSKLYIMQIEQAFPTPQANIKIAVDMERERVINKSEALLNVAPSGLKTLMQPSIQDLKTNASRVLAEGECGYPGCASGVIALSASMALTYASEGKSVIFIQDEFSPKDIEGIAISAGLITLKKGLTTYAGTIAKNKTIPCITNCKRLTYNETNHTIKLGGLNYKEGDKITINASKGYVYGEALALTPSKIENELGTVISWAKHYQKLGVYADCDTPEQVERALELGAVGVGLVRTENMFYQVDRLNALRKYLLSPNKEVKHEVLKQISKYHSSDLIQLFAKIGDRPVTVRLFDATLNEFLPHTQNELRAIARDLKLEYSEIKPILNEINQTNPLLGVRGCRMLIKNMDFAEMQIKTILIALQEVKRHYGFTPQVKLLVPMVSVLTEFEILQRLIRAVEQKAQQYNKNKITFEIGCMIETPRACFIAHKLAEHADFVCFGTNDLTQLTFGFSRDDCMKFLNDYYADNLIYNDPFTSLDPYGVFELINNATQQIRKVKPDMPIWLLGDIDSDTKTLEQALQLNIDYISCAPNNIPAAILAQAQAIIGQKSKENK